MKSRIFKTSDSKRLFFVVVTASRRELDRILVSKVSRFDKWRIKKVFEIKGLWVAVWYVPNLERLMSYIHTKFYTWDKEPKKCPVNFQKRLKRRP